MSSLLIRYPTIDSTHKLTASNIINHTLFEVMGDDINYGIGAVTFKVKCQFSFDLDNISMG